MILRIGRTRDPRGSFPGGKTAISRWLSGATPPEPERNLLASREGCQKATVIAFAIYPLPSLRDGV